MRSLPLLVPSAAHLPEDVTNALFDAIHRETGMRATPARLSSPGLLPQILERSPDVVAWAPSWVAFVLQRLRLADPLVTVVRADERQRSSILVARRGIDGLADLAGRRVGWVSRFSATGYELPRLYLESFGVEVDELFAAQRFLGSHTAASAALARGDVDVIATHSRALRHVFDLMPARILVSIGPVPSDVVVAGAGIPDDVRRRLVRGLRAMRVQSLELGPVRDGHLDLFGMLRRNAGDGGDRALPSHAESAVALH
jgi:ABC-type phosphate/phosphonate transport system substrate-binding protein